MRKILPAALAGALLAPASISTLRAAPLITEFLASNTGGLLDEEATAQDWIEIHNPDATEVDLGGYHLTDDSLQPARWTFPAGFIIPPGGYVTVFASGKNRTAAGAPLHTSFSLAAGGEYLALTAPGGSPVLSEFAPAYPAQTADISYGLLTPAAGAAAGYFNVPTPGAANAVSQAPAGPVQFSSASRTFNQGTSFPLTLSTPSPTATIRYTLNRAVPIAAPGMTKNFTADAATDLLTMTGHGLSDRDEVQLATNSVLPGGSGRG